MVGKKCHVQTTLPKLDEEGSLWIQLEVVLDTREHQLRQRTIHEVLIQWKDTSFEDSMWEPYEIRQQFLHLKH